MYVDLQIKLNEQTWFDYWQNKDPFWEPPETEVRIGCVHVYLQSLAYLIEIEELLGIGDYRGMEQGLLQVDIRPCRPDGSDLSDDEFVDDPKELVSFHSFVCRGCHPFAILWVHAHTFEWGAHYLWNSKHTSALVNAHCNYFHHIHNESLITTLLGPG